MRTHQNIVVGVPIIGATVSHEARASASAEASAPRLKSTCAETFSGFVALASCTRSNSEDVTQPTARGVASYYDVATLEGDDTYYGQCLGTGGSWKIKPKSDPDYTRARARMGGSAPHHEIDSLMELMR